MPQSLAQVYLHVVFSTKQRKRYLRKGALREEVQKYLGGVCRLPRKTAEPLL
jgi:putative transposase